MSLEFEFDFKFFVLDIMEMLVEVFGMECVGIWVFDIKGIEILCIDLFEFVDWCYLNGMVLKVDDYLCYFEVFVKVWVIEVVDVKIDL